MAAASHLTLELIAAHFFKMHHRNKKEADSNSLKYVGRQFLRKMMYFRL